jgi:cation diffusion facilitator CzcD-associated flavoprotein CzcO
MTPSPDAVIIGAGPAGLACAVTMRAAGLNVRVLEKADGVGAVWRRHYDRLHLHTDRNHSGLPGMAMPKAYPAYPSRAQVVDYLESYTAHFGIERVFQTTVSRIGRDGALWRVETSRNSIAAPIVVVATGIADAPYRPSWRGLETYSGALVHSSEYRNPEPHAGKGVLVSASAIPAVRSRSTSPMPASMSRSPCAARSRSFRAICSVFPFCRG